MSYLIIAACALAIAVTVLIMIDGARRDREQTDIIKFHARKEGRRP